MTRQKVLLVPVTLRISWHLQTKTKSPHHLQIMSYSTPMSSEPDDLYSCNGPAAVANEEAGAVDVSQISTKQRN